MRTHATATKGAVVILNQTVATVAADALKTHPRNANQGDVGAIHESIVTNGFWGTIVAQRSTGYVLAGNHRLMAARQAGATEVPVAWVDVDDEAALRILLADNRTTRLGQDDPNVLATLLQELAVSDAGLAGTGYDGDDLDALIQGLQEPGADEWGDALGALPDGDRAPFQQKTFTLHDEQAEAVDRALTAAKGMGPFVDSPNENSNGNALARVAEMFLLWRDERDG